MNLHLTPEMPDVCLSLVLLFTIFMIVVTQKLVLQQSKNVTAKCTEYLSPPPCILYLLGEYNIIYSHQYGFKLKHDQRRKSVFLNFVCSSFVNYPFRSCFFQSLKNWFHSFSKLSSICKYFVRFLTERFFIKIVRSIKSFKKIVLLVKNNRFSEYY